MEGLFIVDEGATHWTGEPVVLDNDDVITSDLRVALGRF